MEDSEHQNEDIDHHHDYHGGDNLGFHDDHDTDDHHEEHEHENYHDFD